MLNIEEVVRRAISATGCAEPILAASFDLPTRLCCELTNRRVIGGYVAEFAIEEGRNDPRVAGWWLDRQAGLWHLIRRGHKSLLFLGPEVDVGGRMLVAARRAGITSLCVLEGGNDCFRRIAVGASLLQRAKTLVVKKAFGSRLLGRRLAAGFEYSGGICYEHAFRDLYEAVGDGLRLQPSEFQEDRALLIVGSLGPGGAERQVALTAIGLAGRGPWKPMVGCSHIEGDAGFHRASVARAHVPVVGIPSAPAEMSDPIIQGALARAQRYQLLGFQNIAHIVLSYACFIRRFRPALVQTWMDYCNVLAGIAADMVGVPALMLSGRSAAPDNFAIFEPYMRPGYIELLRRQPELVFTNNSHAGAADYGRWLGLPKERFVIIHNGSDFPETLRKEEAAAHRRSLGIPERAPVVGSIIRFSEEKQPYLWVDTAMKVALEVPDAYFVAFGAGAMLEEVRAYVTKRGMAERIKLPGIIHDAWAALSMLDVFLLTSRLEGLPNVLIEAQGMGVPVVTTGMGGMPETYVDGATGLTARPPKAETLAAAVSKLLLDQAVRRRMAEEAWRSARAKFSIDTMMRGTLDAFDLATARRREC